MFCPECGAQAADKQKFCMKCGTALVALTAATFPPQLTGAAPLTAVPPPLPPAATVAQARPASHSATEVYASFGRRVLAFIIDYFLLTFVCAVAMAFLPSSSGTSSRGESRALPLVVVIAICWLYKAGMESSAWQGTLGKLTLGIKVTSLGGERIGFWHATGRFLAQFLDVITLYVGYFMAGFTKRRQALHDLAARTLVTGRQHAPQQIAAAQVAPAGDSVVTVVIVLVGGVVIIGILAAIAIPAYQDYTIRAQVTEGLNLAGAYQAAADVSFLAGQDPETINIKGTDIHIPTAGRYVESIAVVDGAVVINYGRAANRALRGHRLIVYPAPSSSSGEVTWVCGYAQKSAETVQKVDTEVGTTDVPAKYLPALCRS